MGLLLNDALCVTSSASAISSSSFLLKAYSHCFLFIVTIFRAGIVVMIRLQDERLRYRGLIPGQEIYFFSKVFSLALGSTQPPVK